MTNHEFVPPYIDEMIQKYKKDENNIFFVITPVNKNVYHGDINHSNVNSIAGGANNTAGNFQKTFINETGALKKDIVDLKTQIKELTTVNNKLLTHYENMKARYQKRRTYCSIKK